MTHRGAEVLHGTYDGDMSEKDRPAHFFTDSEVTLILRAEGPRGFSRCPRCQGVVQLDRWQKVGDAGAVDILCRGCHATGFHSTSQGRAKVGWNREAG